MCASSTIGSGRRRCGIVHAVVYPQKQYRSAKLRVFIEFMTALMADLRRDGIVD
jgi:LysR family transcriptional regulator, regulator for bpeEF and oprC